MEHEKSGKWLHTSAYSEGEKNETFSVTREKTRAHRSFLNPEARESTEISSRDSLGRFLSTGRWKISNSAKCSNVARRCLNFFNVLKTRGTGRWTQSMSFERAREENARVAKGWFRSRNIKFTRSTSRTSFVSRLCSCRAWKAFALFLRRAFLFSPFFSSLLSIIANST